MQGSSAVQNGGHKLKMSPGPRKGGLVLRYVLSVKYRPDSETNIKDTNYLVNDFLW